MRNVTVHISLAAAIPTGIAIPARVRVADAAGDPRGFVFPSGEGGRTP